MIETMYAQLEELSEGGKKESKLHAVKGGKQICVIPTTIYTRPGYTPAIHVHFTLIVSC